MRRLIHCIPALDPRANRPGLRYRHNSISAYTADVVFAEATGQFMADFARTSLFLPSRICRWKWVADAGVTKGQGHRSLKTRDLANCCEAEECIEVAALSA
jgi:hypothetical protein